MLNFSEVSVTYRSNAFTSNYFISAAKAELNIATNATGFPTVAASTSHLYPGIQLNKNDKIWF